MRLVDGRIETAVASSFLQREPVRRIIANNGRIAFTSPGLLLLWEPGTPRLETSLFNPTLESSVIDPSGEFLLGVGGNFHREKQEAVSETLYRLDLNTKALTPVVETTKGVAQPDLAADGHTMVFLSAADWEGKNSQFVKQVWFMDLRSGLKEQLTAETANVKEVVLAGNGAAAFAVTDNLRLLRIDLPTRQVEEIAPEYPRIRAADPVTAAWAHGGRYWLWGRGFGDSEILAGNRSAEITAQSPDDVEFIIPADASTGKNLARVGTKGSPFQPMEIGVSIDLAAPAFLGSGGRETTWLHQDGVTPVTKENPARRGETVTARMTGLGPVDESGSTSTRVHWSLIESVPGIRGGRQNIRTAVPVLRSRATGERGVYLVTIRLPESLRGGDFYQYEGIEAALADGPLESFSSLPLALQ